MKIQIALLGYHNFLNYAQELIDEKLFEVDFYKYECSFEEVLPLAMKLEEKQIDAIITGAVNTSYLKNKIDIPVIELKTSILDILNSVKKTTTEKKIAITFFENSSVDLSIVEELLNIKFEKFFYSNRKELDKQIKKIKKLGYKTVFGNSLSVSIAKSFNLNGIYIHRKEGLKEAIEKTIEVINVKRKEEERTKQIKAIMDYTYNGIISTEKDGHIIFANQAAGKILNFNTENLFNKNIKEIIPNLMIQNVLNNGNIELNQIHQIGAIKIIGNYIPVTVKNKIQGGVFVFEDITHIQQLEEIIRQNLQSKGLVAKYSFKDIVGVSEAITSTIHKAKRFSKSDASVLITGETGTGKEMFAHSIHNNSPRKAFPFVAINCSAIPENLLESELFGYDEGAFTGASKKGKAGLFELAHKGTIFLDEIGTVSKSFQASLLRVLQEKEIIRVGGDKIIPIDVRVIAATNKDLIGEIENNKFRSDLYYRLNILKLRIPPLNERIEDIPELFEFFVRLIDSDIAEKLRKKIPIIINPLLAYAFPGNIRELNSIIERFLVLLNTNKINNNDYLISLISECIEENKIERKTDKSIVLSLSNNYQQDLKEAEKAIIKYYIEKLGDNKSQMAKFLGISRTSLYSKIRDL